MCMTQPHFLVLWLQASHLSSSSLTGFGHPIQKRRVCLVEEDAWVEPWKNKRQSRVELNAFQTNAALTQAAFSSCRVRAIRYSRQTASTAVDKAGAMEWLRTGIEAPFGAGPGWGRAWGPLGESPHGEPSWGALMAPPQPRPAPPRREGGGTEPSEEESGRPWRARSLRPGYCIHPLPGAARACARGLLLC